MSAQIEFIEHRDKSWTAAVLISIDNNCITFSYDDRDPGQRQTLLNSDPKLAAFRKNLTSMEGSDFLIQKRNFLDFNRVIQLIESLLVSKRIEEALKLISGELYYSLYQMLNLDYQQHSGYTNSFHEVIKGTVKLIFYVISSDLVFVEKENTAKGPEETGKKTYSFAWQEMGDIIKAFFTHEATSYYDPVKDAYTDNILKRAVSIITRNEVKSSLCYALKSTLSSKSCIRFVYSLLPLKCIFNYPEEMTGAQKFAAGKPYREGFVLYLKSLKDKEFKYFDPILTKDFLEMMMIVDKCPIDCSSFLFEINIKAMQSSERLLQKLAIVDFICKELLHQICRETIEIVKELKNLCFQHEEIIKRSRPIFEVIVSCNWFDENELNQTASYLQEPVIFSEFILQFSSIASIPVNLGIALFYIILSRYESKYEKSLLELSTTILSKNSEFFHILLKLRLEYNTIPALSRLLASEKSKLHCMHFIKKITATSEIATEHLAIMSEVASFYSPEFCEFLEKRYTFLQSSVYAVGKNFDKERMKLLVVIVEHFLKSKWSYKPIIVKEFIKIIAVNKEDIPAFYGWINEGFFEEHYNFIFEQIFQQIPCKSEEMARAFLKVQNHIQSRNGSALQKEELNHKSSSEFFKGEDALLLACLNSELGSCEQEFIEMVLKLYIEYAAQYDNFDMKIKQIVGKLNRNPSSPKLMKLVKTVHLLDMKNFMNLTISRYYQCAMQLQEGLMMILMKFEEDCFISDLVDIAKKKSGVQANWMRQADFASSLFGSLLFLYDQQYKSDPSVPTSLKKIFNRYHKIKVITQMVLFHSDSDLTMINFLQSHFSTNPSFYYEFLIAENEFFEPTYEITQPLSKVLASSKQKSAEFFFENLEKLASKEDKKKPFNSLIIFFSLTKTLDESFLTKQMIKHLKKLLDMSNCEEILKNIYATDCISFRTADLSEISEIISKELKTLSIKNQSNDSIVLKKIILFYSAFGLPLSTEDILFTSFFNDSSQADLKFRSIGSRKKFYDLIVTQNYNDEAILKILESYRVNLGNFQNYKKSLINLAKKVSFTRKGIRNFGSTCYINSSLQTLYSLSSFRSKILSATPKGDSSNSLFYMFSKLKHSAKSPISTKRFIKKFEFHGQHIDPMQQMDAAEFINALFYSLESELGGEVDKEFKGLTKRHTICQFCQKETQKEDELLMLSLDVKGKKTMKECLENFYKAEYLVGDNKYACDYCNTKRDAAKYVEVTKWPQCLFVAFNRFEYSMAEERTVTINDEIFIEETLTHRDSPIYSLKSIILHIGKDGGGHYVAFIKKKDSWWKFNDDQVTSYPLGTFDINNLKSYVNSQGIVEGTNFNPYILLFKTNLRKEKSYFEIPQEIATKNKFALSAFMFFREDFNYLLLLLISNQKYPWYVALIVFSTFLESEDYEENKVKILSELFKIINSEFWLSFTGYLRQNIDSIALALGRSFTSALENSLLNVFFYAFNDEQSIGVLLDRITRVDHTTHDFKLIINIISRFLTNCQGPEDYCKYIIGYISNGIVQSEYQNPLPFKINYAVSTDFQSFYCFLYERFQSFSQEFQLSLINSFDSIVNRVRYQTEIDPVTKFSFYFYPWYKEFIYTSLANSQSPMKIFLILNFVESLFVVDEESYEYITNLLLIALQVAQTHQYNQISSLSQKLPNQYKAAILDQIMLNIRQKITELQMIPGDAFISITQDLQAIYEKCAYEYNQLSTHIAS